MTLWQSVNDIIYRQPMSTEARCDFRTSALLEEEPRNHFLSLKRADSNQRHTVFAFALLRLTHLSYESPDLFRDIDAVVHSISGVSILGLDQNGFFFGDVKLGI